MVKKLLLIAVVLVGNFLMVLPARAQQANVLSNIPALNPFCWTRKDCLEIRKQYTLSDNDLESGFVTGPSVAPCIGGEGDGEWGRCLPAGQTKTAISFGGQDRFANIGDFILTMYKYLMTMASVVAVIVIIVAGVQWVTSGGNSETISSAKHRIGGAVVGLFIAYMSYFILNTVNPAIVNFRLPQTWLIKPQSLVPTFCKDIPGAKDDKLGFIFYSGLTDDQQAPVDPNKADKSGRLYRYGEDKDYFACGTRYLPDGVGNQACFGDRCPSEPGNRRICGTQTLENKTIYCIKGDLRIHYYATQDNLDLKSTVNDFASELPVVGFFFSKAMHQTWLSAESDTEDNEVFWGVCERADGKRYLANGGEGKRWPASLRPVSNVSQKAPYWEYLKYFDGLVDWEDKGWDCRKGGTLVGYYIRVETWIEQSGWEMVKDAFTSQVEYPNMSIGYDSRSGQAVYGTFAEDVIRLNKEPINYIPIEQLKNGGIQLEVGLTMGKLLRMREHSGQNPGNYAKVFESTVDGQPFDFGNLFDPLDEEWERRILNSIK